MLLMVALSAPKESPSGKLSVRGKTRITALLVITKEEKFVPPCGFCRQILSEFTNNCPIAILNNQGKIKETTLDELLPYRFDKNFI